MFAAEARGELEPGTARRWAHETKNIKKLPEKVKPEPNKHAQLAHDRDSGSGLPKEQIGKGSKVELEHTHSPTTARQIAIDHLREKKDYYKLLDKYVETAKEAKAYKLQGERKFQGLDIAIENKKGSTRKWYDPHGKESGSTLMHADYGYIRRTEGTDGDHVDVYVGDDESAQTAYVIDQMKKPEFKEFDEQKVMLGFASPEAAKALYLKQYDDPRFFGKMKALPMAEFRSKVLDKSYHGEKVSTVVAGQTRTTTPPTSINQDESAERGEDRMQKKCSHIDAVARTLELAGKSTDWVDEAHKLALSKEDVMEGMDNAGLALLAAPYVASGVGNVLAHRPGVLGAIGQAAQRGASFMHHHQNKLEPLGLAMVSPGVGHRVARAVASEPAKQASAVTGLGRLAGGLERAVAGGRSAGASMLDTIRRGRAGFDAARLGLPSSFANEAHRLGQYSRGLPSEIPSLPLHSSGRMSPPPIPTHAPTPAATALNKLDAADAGGGLLARVQSAGRAAMPYLAVGGAGALGGGYVAGRLARGAYHAAMPPEQPLTLDRVEPQRGVISV